MTTDDKLTQMASIGLAAAAPGEPLPADPTPARRRATITVSGVVADSSGLCIWDQYGRETLSDGTLRAHHRRVFRHDSASAYAAQQPGRIPVLLDHDAKLEIGEVVHLERRHGQLYAVALLDGQYEEFQGRSLCWSSSTTSHKPPFTIKELSLTAAPASVGLPEVAFRSGDLSAAVAFPGNRELLQRAIAARKRRAKGDPLWIHDDEVPDFGDRDADVLMERSATALHISTSMRLIEIVAVPYGQPARVFWRDSWWSESFEFGAFAAYIRSGALPRVNREHTKGDTVGKVTAFRETPEGLTASIRIAETPRGDETLALAKEDMISASVAFAAEPGGRLVDNGQRSIRITRARLDHVALVEGPAYQGARVLSVRRRAG